MIHTRSKTNVLRQHASTMWAIVVVFASHLSSDFAMRLGPTSLPTSTVTSHTTAPTQKLTANSTPSLVQAKVLYCTNPVIRTTNYILCFNFPKIRDRNSKNLISFCAGTRPEQGRNEAGTRPEQGRKRHKMRSRSY